MRRAVGMGLAVTVIGLAFVVFAASKLDLFSSPGGGRIGTYSGSVAILAVEDDWVAVRMTAWVPKEQLSPDMVLPSSREEGSSRSNAAPIGTTLVAEWSDGYVANATLLEVIRGENAWRLIREASAMWNNPPEAGYEYLLARVRFVYVKGPDQDTTYNVYGSRFTAISETGLEYDDTLMAVVVVPKPELDATLYPGASYEGWAVYQVKEDDTHPLLTFGRDYRGRGGIWFKLY